MQENQQGATMEISVRAMRREGDRAAHRTLAMLARNLIAAGHELRAYEEIPGGLVPVAVWKYDFSGQLHPAPGTVLLIRRRPIRLRWRAILMRWWAAIRGSGNWAAQPMLLARTATEHAPDLPTAAGLLGAAVERFGTTEVFTSRRIRAEMLPDACPASLDRALSALAGTPFLGPDGEEWALFTRRQARTGRRIFAFLRLRETG